MLRISKTVIGLVALSFLFLASASNAEDYYYYSLGQQIPVEPSDSVITAVPKNTRGTLEIDHSCIDQSYPPVSINGTAAEYHLEEGWAPDSALTALEVWGGVAIANPVLSTPDSNPVYLSDELFVRFEDDTPYYACEAIISGFGCEIIQDPYEIYDDFPDTLIDLLWQVDGFVDEQRYFIRATAASSGHLLQVANQFYEHEMVEYAVPNFYNNMRVDATPNDEYFSFQWYLNNEDFPGADIDFNRAIEFTEATTDVVIGVVDVGFDLNHEDIDPSRVFITYDAAGDDLSDTTSKPDMDVSLPDSIYDDDRQLSRATHGTNVLGLLMAMTNNETGIAGLAPNYRFMVAKAYDNNLIWSDKAGALGIDACALMAAFGWCDVIVTPWHEAKVSDDVEAALKRAHKYHAVAFAPSGNSHRNPPKVLYPGSSEYTIAVGATNKWDGVRATSGQGEMLDLVAPGEGIWTIDRMGMSGVVPYGASCYDHDYHCSFQGTSASCAIAAGVAAMVFAHCPEAMSPSWWELGEFGHPVDFIRTVFENTCDDMVGSDQIPGWDSIYGHGRLNAFKAVYSVSRGDANNSGVIDIDDISYLIAYVFQGGPEPEPYATMGDVNRSSAVDVDDIVYLIAYVFQGGPSPREPFFDFPG